MSRTFGERLKHLRGGLTSKRAAELIGVSQPTWTTWEIGTREPNIDTIIAICDQFNTTPNELLGFGPPPEPIRAIKAAPHSAVAVVNGSNNKISQVVNPQKRKARR